MKSDNYKNITDLFFDLDHTLWDFEKNSEVTLQELYTEYQLSTSVCSEFDAFLKRYQQINFEMWHLYNLGQITKEQLRIERFRQLFYHFGVRNNSLADEIDKEYIKRCPVKGNLMKGCIETLDALQPHYKLHVISNGFEQTTHRKINSTPLAEYFLSITSSEKAESTKPREKIFRHALDGLDPKSAIMIGDNLNTDIAGANKLGMLGIWYNPLLETGRNLEKFNLLEINHLEEIPALLLQKQ